MFRLLACLVLGGAQEIKRRIEQKKKERETRQVLPQGLTPHDCKAVVIVKLRKSCYSTFLTRSAAFQGLIKVPRRYNRLITESIF